jgi:hypothetical protein
MARRFALIITTVAAIALTACANPTAPSSSLCGGGATTAGSGC